MIVVAEDLPDPRRHQSQRMSMAMASRDSGLPSFCRAIEAAGQSPAGRLQLNKEAPLVSIWKDLKDQVLVDKARGGCCPTRATAAFCGWPAVLRISEEALLTQSAERTRHLVAVAEF
jgi:hypothetical protein